ncbi:MAG TPA: hypothetical protein VIE36_22205 [Methylomirabilota bacterium]|jgi:cytochrome c553
MKTHPRVLGLAALCFVVLASAAVGGRHLPLGIPAGNDSGMAQTLVAEGPPVTLDEPFFQSLGTNDRTCVTCHAPTEGWSLEPADVQRRFQATGGRHPLFRPVDGAVTPYADVRTVSARRQAYALLLERGVIRVGLPMPATADFTLVTVEDPYGFASVAELSLFRRPLPSTNLHFLRTVMWDGRESTGGRSIHGDLMLQANDATVGHAQALPIDDFTRRRIVDFELRLTTAQMVDRRAGRLDADGARGGPGALAAEAAETAGVPAAAGEAFTIFTQWTTAVGHRSPARQAIARGQRVFNTATHNGRLMCAGCHNMQNVGTNAAPLFFKVGVGELGPDDPPPADLPLYTLQCHADGRLVRTTDPGRALITGLCADIGKFKTPILRGLATRAPYFHDGSAATVEDVVAHYKNRFGFQFSGTEEADLIAFLRAL